MYKPNEVNRQNVIDQELQLMQRFAELYRPKVQQMLHRLASKPVASEERQSLKLCIEAMDMLLTSQSRIAGALDRRAA
jgi:hypothetical protein